MRIAQIGRVLFGIGLAGFALLSFVYGNLVPILAPFPWSEKWTHGLGVILMAASAGLFFARTVLYSTIIVCVGALTWAVAAAGPILHSPLSVGSWYNSSEAVTTLVGVWVLYAMLRRRDGTGAVTPMTSDGALRVGRALFGAACVVYGVAHFAYASYTEAFVPTWLPARMASVYLTGAFHTAAGVALIIGVLPRLAAWLEALMMSLFGILIWLPSFFAQPVPKWAGSPQNQWSETFMNFLLAGAAWIIAASLRSAPCFVQRRPGK